MSQEAVRKMAELGVVANLQPAWLWLDSHTAQAVRPQRTAFFQPTKIFQQGAIVGGGSDH
jgi:predicted amidohydrolase YtcJ